MEKLTRFGISMEKQLLERFDPLVKEKGYANRSEAIRDLIRQNLVEEEWKADKNKETIGVITLVYNHHTHDLSDKLNDIQHHHHTTIISTTHIHLDEHHCLEVLIAKGKGELIRKIAEKLIATRGVKYGKLTHATTGKEL